MIVGIGTDIIEIARLARSLEKVKAHCFTPAEVDYCERFRDNLTHYAGRWAAKEAFAKALGCGFGADCAWDDLEILNNENGKPVMTIAGKALQTFEKIGGETIHLSISHEKNHATAFVILEGEK
ncbi:MAG: holo-ACP synthase [Lentisphaeria bacterium]|nr:holo-ACP synthase [Lentisphaeria bacterium]